MNWPKNWISLWISMGNSASQADQGFGVLLIAINNFNAFILYLEYINFLFHTSDRAHPSLHKIIFAWAPLGKAENAFYEKIWMIKGCAARITQG
jgi:hypothetical protein